MSLEDMMTSQPTQKTSFHRQKYLQVENTSRCSAVAVAVAVAVVAAAVVVAVVVGSQPSGELLQLWQQTLA